MGDWPRSLKADVAERAKDLLGSKVVFLTGEADTEAQLITLIRGQTMATLNRRFVSFYDPKNLFHSWVTFYIFKGT